MAFITSSNPIFIKVILDHTLLQGKIDVPKKFVINNGGGGSLFHKTATLRLPSGAIWNVQVEKSGGKVLFSRGWPEFLKFYSIRSGYFIIFKFVGDSCFDVSIIDWSATEIDYPVKLQINSGLAVTIESESDEETEITKKNENDRDEDLEMNFLKRQSNVRGSGSNHGDDDDSKLTRPTNPRKRLQPWTKNRADLFNASRKNPSFMVTMRPSNLHGVFYLNLPNSFAEKYVKESMDVKLELDDGRVWSVWCGVRWTLKHRRTEFRGGWKAFTIDNELHSGDSCVFEWIPRSPLALFKVTIFRRPLN